MDITIYVTPSESNRLDKELTHPLEIQGTLRDASSVLTPIFRVQRGQGITNYNYAHIPQFGRYYYITDIVSVNNGLWELSLSVDPLMSFNEAIRKVTAIAARSESTFNAYIPDSEFTSDNRPLYRYSKLGEFNVWSYFLSVLGGYSS